MEGGRYARRRRGEEGKRQGVKEEEGKREGVKEEEGKRPGVKEVGREVGERERGGRRQMLSQSQPQL